MKILELLFNPYRKLSEIAALVVGALFIPITSYFCHYSGGMFSDFLNFSGGAANVSFVQILLVNVSMGLLASLVFLALAKLFSRSKIRAIDVVGYILFAQVPLVVVPILFLPEASAVFLTPPNPMPQEWVFEHATPFALALMSAAIVPLAWCWILMFNALKISANLSGGRLWSSYLLGIFITVAAMRLAVFPLIVHNVADFKPGNNARVPLEASASALGMYEGVLEFPGQTLRFRLYIDNDGTLKVYSTSPDQGDQKIPIKDFHIDAGGVSFSIPNLSVKFNGGFSNSNGKTIEGVFKQGSYSIPLKMAKMEELYYTASVALASEASKEKMSYCLKRANEDEFLKGVASRLNKDFAGLIKAWNPGRGMEEIIKESGFVRTLRPADDSAGVEIFFTAKFAGVAQGVAMALAREIADKSVFWGVEFDTKILGELNGKLESSNDEAQKQKLRDEINGAPGGAVFSVSPRKIPIEKKFVKIGAGG